jgi:hypothetical protein
MLLRDIKEGEIYAYINGYGEKTRHQSVYCGNLPPARAMEVVKKEKRLVEIRKDSCGRPKMQNQTFIICKKFDVDPTDMLAADLDIVEDNHKDLVEFDIEVDAADLIWPWEMEVEQARENAEVMRQVDLRVAYVKGVAHRVNRWLVQSEKEICDAVCKRAKVAAKESYEGRSRYTEEEDVSLEEWLDKYAGVHLSTEFHVNSLKQIAYSIMKNENVGYSGSIEIRSRISCPKSNDGWGYRHHRDLETLCFTRHANFSQGLFSVKTSCVGLKGYEEYVALYDQIGAYERANSDQRSLVVKTTEEYQEMRQRYGKLETELWNQFLALTKLEKVSILDNSLNRLKVQVEEKFGKRLPKFDAKKKNWVAWAAEEKEKAEAAK